MLAKTSQRGVSSGARPDFLTLRVADAAGFTEAAGFAEADAAADADAEAAGLPLADAAADADADADADAAGFADAEAAIGAELAVLADALADAPGFAFAAPFSPPPADEILPPPPVPEKVPPLPWSQCSRWPSASTVQPLGPGHVFTVANFFEPHLLIDFLSTAQAKKPSELHGSPSFANESSQSNSTRSRSGCSWNVHDFGPRQASTAVKTLSWHFRMSERSFVHAI